VIVKTLSVILTLTAALAAAATLATALPAGASWVEKTIDWNLPTFYSRMIADEGADTLYYFHAAGPSWAYMKGVYVYDSGTDSWSELTVDATGTAFGYEPGDKTVYTPAGGAGRFVGFGDANRKTVTVYDIATQTMYDSTDIDTGSAYTWRAGSAHAAVYNPTLTGVDPAGEYWCIWTPDEGGFVARPFYPTTAAWGPEQLLTQSPPVGGHVWNRDDSLNVGNTNYASREYNPSTMGRYVTLIANDLTDASWPNGIYGEGELFEYTSSYDLGAGRYIGTQTSGMYSLITAVHGTDIYVTGVKDSDLLLNYDILTDTWQELTPRPDDDPNDGTQQHYSYVVGSTLYVQDGDQFWTYDLTPIPGPGDVDGNLVVNGLDLTAVLTAWDTIPGDALWNPDADLDGNNVINGPRKVRRRR
jgi:hypothetical protein